MIENIVAMVPEQIIYTDGHDVVVTDTQLKVKNTSYRLAGITKFYLWTIRPDRWPSVLLMLVGIGIGVLGFMRMIPMQYNVATDNGSLDINMLAMWIGAGLFLIGIIILAVSRVRYAVRIGTAEGEKNAVVSVKKEYISQIVDAIHSAFDSSQNRPAHS
jgi:hypothetical protein